jgi:histidine kinase/DNA gyrase B/HSP90-like ATPase
MALRNVLADSLAAKDLSVRVSLQLDPPLDLVLVDRVQIQQVLLNLLRNALEAMQTSERRELNVSTSPAEDNMVAVDVGDTGCGISRAASSSSTTWITGLLGIGEVLRSDATKRRSYVSAEFGQFFGPRLPLNDLPGPNGLLGRFVHAAMITGARSAELFCNSRLDPWR